MPLVGCDERVVVAGWECRAPGWGLSLIATLGGMSSSACNPSLRFGLARVQMLSRNGS